MKRKIFIIIMLSLLLLTMTSCRKKLTVIFDYIYKTEEVTVKKGKKLEKPEEPNRYGYTFLEWQLDGESYDFSKKVKKSITLVATYSDDEEPIVTLDTPQNVKYENNTITWDKVNNATSYKVNIDGTIYNTTDTSYNYTVNLEEKGFVTITVVACSNKGVSKTSKAIFAEKSFTNEQIKEMLGISIEELEDEKYASYYRSICAALTKYNFTIKEMNKIRDIEDLVENNRLADYIGVYTFINNIDVKFMFDNLETINKPDLDEELQILFDDMKNKNIYSSNYTKATDDDKFMYLVVGGIGYLTYLSPIKPSKIISVYDYLNHFINYDGYASKYMNLSFEIRKNNDEIIFICQSNGEEYKLNADELLKIVEYYYNTKQLEYQNLVFQTAEAKKEIFNTEYQYGTYIYDLIEYNKYKQACEDIYEQEVKLYNLIEVKKEQINKIFKDFYNLYESFNNGTYSDLEEILEKVQNGDTSKETITSLKNKIIEIMSIIQNTFTSKEDIAIIFDIIDNAKFLTSNSNDAQLKLIENLVNIMLDGIKYFEQLLNEISVEDLQTILKIIEDPTNQEALNKIEELYEKINTSLSIVDYSTIDLKLILDSLESSFISNFGANYKSILSVQYGIKFSDEEINLLEEEIEELIKYIEKYPNKDDIKIIINEILQSNENLNNKQVVTDFIKYLLDYMTTSKLDKFSFYIKSYIKYLNKDNAFNVEQYYEITKNNFEILKKFKYVELKITIETSEYSDNEKLKKSLQIIKEEFTNEEMQAYLFAKKQMENLVNNTNETIVSNPFYNDFSANMEKLLVIANKTSSQITSDENKLIVEFRKIFNEVIWGYAK